MSLVRCADRLRSRFRQPDVTDQTLIDEKFHRTDGILDRDVGIDPMLAEQIDIIDAQPLETGDARLNDVFGPAVDAAAVPARLAELGREDGFVASAFDRASDQFLVLAVAIGVSGIEQAHAGIEGMLDGRDRFPVVERAILDGHAHAAKADGRNFEAALPECALSH